MSRKKRERSEADAPASPVDEEPGPTDGDSPDLLPPPSAAPDIEVAPEATVPTGPSSEQRIAALETEKEEIRNRMLRIAADFENWKKRSRKEQADAESQAREGVLRDVLEVLDNLERATAAYGDSADPAAVVKGVGLVVRLFQSKLERWDVKPISAKGQAFDPRVHEAISKIAAPDVAPGTVVSEMQRGYRIGERLLRPAIVAVAAPAEPASPPPEPAPASEGSADGAPAPSGAGSGSDPGSGGGDAGGSA